jgi:hypothetical protein
MAKEQLGSNTPEGCEIPGLNEVAPTASGRTTNGEVVLTAEQSGGTFLWDLAAGIDYVLPAPTAGMCFNFYATVSVTSNTHAISTDAATTFIGGSLSMGIAAADTNEMQVGDETSDVTIAMNGSTTGGLKGTYIEVLALSSTVWIARRSTVIGSGALATPFA